MMKMTHCPSNNKDDNISTQHTDREESKVEAVRIDESISDN